VGDGKVSEIALQRPQVGALVNQGVAASMPEHMRVRLERQFRLGPGPRHKEGKARRRERPAPLGHEDEIGMRPTFSLEPPQRPQFVALYWVDGRGAALDPPDMQTRLIEIDLRPTQLLQRFPVDWNHL